MNLIGILEGYPLRVACKALKENRLWFRVTDQYGRSCNGGQPIVLPPSSNGHVGKWLPKIKDVCICSRGYHVTKDPILWKGCVVTLVEIDHVVDQQDDKAVCHTMRELGIVDPNMCVDQRLYCVVKGRFALSRANLSGADLSGADLSRADLSGADLSRANLSGADLSRANLSGADLSRANLYGSNLSRADLYGSNLSRANLSGANLSGADLSRANLSGADLSGANLSGADLSRANLYGADLRNAIGIDKVACKNKGAIVE